MDFAVFGLLATVLLAMGFTITEGDVCVCAQQYKPVCASNGTTFPNRCVLDCAIKTNPNITFGHDGDCEDKRGDKSAGGGKAGAWGTTAGPNNPYLIALITFTFMSYFGFKFCM